MSCPSAPQPGQGAAHLTRAPGQYVYLVRSVRSGRPSLGIDLTPNAACPLACDYCQVPRGGRASQPLPIDVVRLRDEVESALDQFGFLAKDVTFAGSGEPTWSPQFAAALAMARELTTSRPRHLPIRVLPSGVTLDLPDVARALANLAHSDDGEVWVKLDAWDEVSYRRAAGVRRYGEQERRIVRFARTTPVVLQIMLVHRRNGLTIDEAVSGLTAALERLTSAGCRLDRVVLSTLFRPPGDPNAEVSALGQVEMALVADAIATTGVQVDGVRNPR